MFNLGVGSLLLIVTGLSGFILENQPEASPGFTKTLTTINTVAKGLSEKEELLAAIDSFGERRRERRNTPVPAPKVPL